jgi:hypothetical protein
VQLLWGWACRRATSCATCHVGSPPYRWARTPEQASDRRSMASLREHCVPTGVTRHLPLGRRHAAAAHTRAGAPPSATGRSPAARRQPPWRPCRGSYRHDARAKLLATLLAYKPRRVSSLRVPENTAPAAIAIRVAVVSLLFRLFSGPTEPLAPSPNLHQSLPDHLWLSSPLTFARNLAAAEVPRLPRHWPSPGHSSVKSPSPIDL